MHDVPRLRGWIPQPFGKLGKEVFNWRAEHVTNCSCTWGTCQERQEFRLKNQPARSCCEYGEAEALCSFWLWLKFEFVDSGRDHTSRYVVTCSKCKKKTYTNCNQTEHSRECPKRNIREKATKYPGCKAWFVLEDGCNAVRCTCDTSPLSVARFCFVRRLEVTQLVIL